MACEGLNHWNGELSGEPAAHITSEIFGITSIGYVLVLILFVRIYFFLASFSYFVRDILERTTIFLSSMSI
jgi:hypothetical protein